MTVYLGIDLGWYGKPSGLAAITPHPSGLQLTALARLTTHADILHWITQQCAQHDAVAAIDAPTIINNATGIRPAERALNHDFRRFHAGCHAANLGLPFAQHVLAFSRALQSLGFQHGAAIQPHQPGRWQIEVHPHAASVRLFSLPQIVKYKRGLRAHRARELRRFRTLLLQNLPHHDPPLTLRLPAIPATGNLKPVEDQIDAVLCAYIAAHYHYYAQLRNTVYGTNRDGFIVVPQERQPQPFDQ